MTNFEEYKANMTIEKLAEQLDDNCYACDDCICKKYYDKTHGEVPKYNCKTISKQWLESEVDQ